METSGSGTYTVRLWLRTYEDYDETHIEPSELDHIRELLEEKSEEQREDEDAIAESEQE